MTERVAGLWRAQGETFLNRHHATVLDDVARLRGAVIVGGRTAENDGPTWHDRLDAAMSRLRGWDEVVLERLREMHAEEEHDRVPAQRMPRAERPARAPRPRPVRASAVIDLTGAEPTVDLPPAGWSTCGRCKRTVDDDRLVRPYGERKPPLCLPCARQVAGVRPRSR